MRGRRETGFTVVELLVSTAILMLVMLIAVQVLGEAGRMLSRAQVELTQPSNGLARQWLRRDIQGASAVGRLAFLATSEPLILQGHREGVLSYQLVGSDLDRVIMVAGGEETGRRTIMRGVARWQWRTLSSGLVEIEITFRRLVPLRTTRFSGSPTDVRVISEVNRYALRGAQRRSW